MEKCQRCGEDGEDRRTLWMACFYEMIELGLPFEKDDKFYKLLVCKDCRADWLSAIQEWFNTMVVRESCGSGIFVRKHGASVEISDEEWYREHPGREPIRFKP